jgi:hypothetical protein
MIFKVYICIHKNVEKIGDFAQISSVLAEKFYDNIMTIKKVDHFLAENLANSPKIMIITLTPGSGARFGACLGCSHHESTYVLVLAGKSLFFQQLFRGFDPML